MHIGTSTPTPSIHPPHPWDPSTHTHTHTHTCSSSMSIRPSILMRIHPHPPYIHHGMMRPIVVSIKTKPKIIIIIINK
jgi:hypothetical protein